MTERAVLKSAELPNGIRIPYAEQGDADGPAVLILHGFADSWRSFELVLAHLPDSLHALAPTQRGHGDASHPASDYAITDLAADVAGFLDVLDLQRAVIVGHSMGSAVAVRFAIDRPDRVLGLVLVGASPTMGGSEAARAFWDSTVSKLTDPVDPALVRGMTESLLVRPVPHAFLETAIAEGLKVPAFVWRAAFESRWRLEGDYSAELGNIAAPTLVVWGDRDARYGRSEQDALVAGIMGARLIVYEGAGHLLHWEEPERFASDLVAFASGLPHRGS